MNLPMEYPLLAECRKCDYGLGIGFTVFWDSGYSVWRVIAEHPERGFVNTNGNSDIFVAMMEAENVLRDRPCR